MILRSADINRDCALFLIINKPQDIARCKVDILDSTDFIVRIRTNEINKITEERRETAIYSGVQIIPTDYPSEDNLTHDDQTVTFDNGKTTKKVKRYNFTHVLTVTEKRRFFVA